MAKDWVGNQNSIYKTLGASNHVAEVRAENDFYATDPNAVSLLLYLETFQHRIWEPAAGQGHISKVLEANGFEVRSTDLVDRGYGQGGVDFLAQTEKWDGDVITNPPYAHAHEFVLKALALTAPGAKIAMFLKLQFLEGQERRELFRKHPPKTVWVSSARLACAKNGEFPVKGSSAVAFAWFIWEVGYKGPTTLKWFN